MPAPKPEQPCPQADKHTPAPSGYLAWHEWAEEMAKTHRSTRCGGCGLYKVWIPKEASMPETHTVRPGQVWADNDWRSAGRKIRVIEITETHAVVEQHVPRSAAHLLIKPRRSRIRLDRFRPTSTGYRLIQEAPDAD